MRLSKRRSNKSKVLNSRLVAKYRDFSRQELKFQVEFPLEEQNNILELRFANFLSWILFLLNLKRSKAREISSAIEEEEEESEEEEEEGDEEEARETQEENEEGLGN